MSEPVSREPIRRDTRDETALRLARMIERLSDSLDGDLLGLAGTAFAICCVCSALCPALESNLRRVHTGIEVVSTGLHCRCLEPGSAERRSGV